MKIKPHSKYIKYWSEYKVGDNIIVADNEFNRKDPYLIRIYPVNTIVTITKISGDEECILIHVNGDYNPYDIRRFYIYENKINPLLTSKDEN